MQEGGTPMYRKYIFLLSVLVALVAMVLVSYNYLYAKDKSVNELKAQIETLQEKVKELETGHPQSQGGQPGSFNRRKKQVWDPFREMQRMQEEMDRIFQDSFSLEGGSSKAIFSGNIYYDDSFDIRDEDDKYVITFNMKGLNQGKTDIQVNQNTITIKGEHITEETEEGQDRCFTLRSMSTYVKSISVPKDADIGKMKTEQKENKLIITLPKKSRYIDM
jgi:HSP20 family protein